jgi:hypothetical protein
MGVIFLDEPKNIRVSSNQHCAKAQQSVFDAGVPRDRGAIAVLVSATSFNDQRDGKCVHFFVFVAESCSDSHSDCRRLILNVDPPQQTITFRPLDHVVFSFGRSSAHSCSAWSNTVYNQNTYLNDVLLTQEGDDAGASYHGETAMQLHCGYCCSCGSRSVLKHTLVSFLSVHQGFPPAHRLCPLILPTA